MFEGVVFFVDFGRMDVVETHCNASLQSMKTLVYD